MRIWWLATIPGIVVALGVQFMLHGIRIEREMKRCRYDRALKMLDGPLSWPSASLYKSFRAGTLFFQAGLRKRRRYYANWWNPAAMPPTE
jgi:hypothetical protein